ncbi:TPA: glycosyltransferase family 4 protein [Vibrio cholerae]|uniref:glycosyltransferase family 4 protein n=1 Tax=Vibrio cholerae TaxID=666 RepID=UPI00209604B6|nr:glycosyltransferase family 4 protein [Vibrio cholerae]EGR4436422.1 glycosyltransferase [Vibrio cholerae]MCO7071814.1 glycosyltransferase family 4 protein [Vibrio cholerae]
MKKIVFVDSYHTGNNGAPTSMLALAKGLSEKGHAITVASSKNGGLLNKAIHNNLEALELAVPNPLLGSRKDFNISTIIQYILSLVIFWFSQVFRYSLKKFDIICVNDIRSFLFYLPLLFIARDKVVWYVRINDRVPYITTIAAYIAKKIILISSDCINVFSVREKHKFSNKFTILNTGFRFSPIDAHVVSEIESSIIGQSKSKVFISVGSICQRKNQIDIVRAYASTCSPNDILLLIGSPTSEEDLKYEAELVRVIESLDIVDQVKRIPHTPFVHEYLSIADIFLFASRQEGLPRVVIEALHAGCFVCSSKVDGIIDILTAPQIGVFTSSNPDRHDFLDEFKVLISSVDKYTLSLRSERKAFVLENFDYENFIIGFEKIVIY